jgi:hypothetical protein
MNATLTKGLPSRFGRIIAAPLLVVGIAGCESDFDVLNTDPTSLTAIEPTLQLNTAILQSVSLHTSHTCEGNIVQHNIRLFSGVGACANFNLMIRDVSDSNWNNGYLTRLRNLVDVLDKTKDDPLRVNLHSMARIWTAYTFMRLTDSYGDVPYTEAARGFLEGIANPQYDSQEFIYTSSEGILEELKNATAALDPNSPTPATEVLYGGDIERWRRLGSSLLLRAAMRLTKVAPAIAEEYATLAISQGVMTSNDDNAMVRHTTEFPCGSCQTVNGVDGPMYYIAEDFVEFLRSRNDPRLGSIAVRYVRATSTEDQRNRVNETTAPEDQVGMPAGFDQSTIGPFIAALGDPDLPAFFSYSQIDRNRIWSPLAPNFLITYSQTQLLVAEAVARGWVSGDIPALYESAQRANMQRISTSYPNTQIAQSAIDNFVAANPFVPGTLEQQLEQINNEYWVVSFLINDEAWANFRRSDYPTTQIVTPNPLRGDLGGSDEAFMRRFGYPDTEIQLNPNVVNGTTPDQISTRGWWDVRN